MTGIELIAAERIRQIDVEGFTPEHDCQHDGGAIAAAAGCYALYNWSRTDCERLWPFGSKWWKPSNYPIRNLIKAGALIAAEIDRIQKEKMSEDLSDEDRDRIFIKNICPDCGSSGFLAGPEGGCSQNIKCRKCGSKFNICPPFFAERI